VVILAVGALAVGLGIGAMLDRAVLPDVEQGEFTVRLTLPRGTPLEETEAAAGRIETAAIGDPDVETVFTRVGRQAAVAGVEDEESGLHTAEVTVHLTAHATTREVVERVRGGLAGIPTDALAVETGTATALGRLLGGEDADLAIRLRGDDLDQLRNHAALVLRRLQQVPALTNVRLRSEEGQPEIRIEVARERAAAYGIEPRRIAETVEQYMRGAVATEYVDFDEKVPVVVRLPEAQRRSLETLREIRLDGIPLRELVTTHEEVGPAEVRHRDQGRVIEIYADRAGSALDEAITAVRAALAEVPPPKGVRVEIGGAGEERTRSFRDLAFAFGLALILVYMILAAQFESFVHPLTILLAVPLSIVGGTLALAATGEGLNTMSLIGAVILVGIVVNDAIVKVEFINQLRAQGLGMRDAILEAGRKRLRPILMTTVTTVLGLLPMALGFGRGADLRQPLAVVVIGGLTSATMLTLIVVPVAYSLVSGARATGRGST
jgi:HAE1 family hydrophobic/amphiphilic exporter-1